MPNWCDDVLTVEGDPSQVAAFVERANGPEWPEPECDEKKRREPPVSVLAFQRIVPVPVEPSQHIIDAQMLLWGVKWGADEPKIVEMREGFVKYYFATPNSPPLAFTIRASRQFPGLWFSLHFSEVGMDFLGEARIANGRIESMLLSDGVLEGKTLEDAEQLVNTPEESVELTDQELMPNREWLTLKAKDFGGTQKLKQFVETLDSSLLSAFESG